MTDKTLIQWIKSGNSKQSASAWDYIYGHFYPMVLKYITGNSGTADDATDIFQDSLLVLNRSLKQGKFRQNSSLKTYVYGIARRLWLKKLSAENNRNETIHEYQQYTQQEGSPTINTTLVRSIISELPAQCQEVLVAYYFRNQDMSEIKELLDMASVEVARTTKYRCLKKLTALLRQYGIDHEKLLEDER